MEWRWIVDFAKKVKEIYFISLIYILLIVWLKNRIHWVHYSQDLVSLIVTPKYQEAQWKISSELELIGDFVGA